MINFFLILWFVVGYFSWFIIRKHLTDSESQIKPLMKILVIFSGLFSAFYGIYCLSKKS
jgi:hypothetical protein